MKKSLFLLYLPTLLLNFIFLFSIDEMQLTKTTEIQSKVKKFKIDQTMLQKLKNTDNSNIIKILPNNLSHCSCITTINNEEYIQEILSFPFLMEEETYPTLNLVGMETTIRKFYAEPLLQTINESTKTLNNYLGKLEKENQNLKAQLKKQASNSPKIYSILTGLSIFCTGLSIQYLYHHLTIDLSTFFNHLSSVILIKK